MSILGHMIVPVVPTLGIPNMSIAVMAAWVFAVDSWLRIAVRPNTRNAVLPLDPSEKAAKVGKGSPGLGLVGKANRFNLNG